MCLRPKAIGPIFRWSSAHLSVESTSAVRFVWTVVPVRPCAACVSECFPNCWSACEFQDSLVSIDPQPFVHAVQAGAQKQQRPPRGGRPTASGGHLQAGAHRISAPHRDDDRGADRVGRSAHPGAPPGPAPAG